MTEHQHDESALPDGHRPVLSAIELVPVTLLLPADSPRTAGESAEHVHALAHSGAVLPPIIVHRASMRVVDGSHRLQAAVERGEEVIRARFFEGPERDAFLIAVRENTSHGLPLSVGDRAAAAARIVRSHGHWSDRAIAEVAGLSAKSVSEIRRAAQGETGQPTARLGLDGKVRPLNTSQGRIVAGRLIAQMPGASLRHIAQLAGISPGTVRDVRARLARGEHPVPEAMRTGGPDTAAGPEAGQPAESPRGPAPDPAERPVHARAPEPVAEPVRPPAPDTAAALRTLSRDPSLRYVEQGRSLLRALGVNALPEHRWDELASAVPAHSAALVSRVAREYAAAWTRFAERLERNA